jgi:hypothetical protein
MDTLYDYDNFDGVELINSELWHHTDSENLDQELDYSLIRKIVSTGEENGMLLLGVTASSESGWGDNYDGPGFGLRFSNPYDGGPEDITAIEAAMMTWNAYITPPCGTQYFEIPEIRFDITGSWFSTGLAPVGEECGPDPASWNEVSASLMLRSRPGSAGRVFDVWVRIFQSPFNPSFDHWFDLGSDLGWTLRRREGAILGIRWNQPGQSFVFRMNDQTHEISYATWLANIGGTDTDPPCGPFKALVDTVFLPNACTGISMGSSVFLIDNVRIETAPPWNGG